MNFNHIEYAVEVARAGSIRKASQNLYVSQPYLSGMIKGLEEELGYYIFNRTAAGITLTREGEEFIQSANVILLELKKMKEIIPNKEERQLNIATYYSTLIMDLFLKFHNVSAYKFSDTIKEMGFQQVLESVRSGESTVGFIFYLKKNRQNKKKMKEEEDLCFHELMEPMPMYVLIHKTHPLAEMKGIKAANLGDYPYVTYNDSGARRFLDVMGIQEHPELLEVSDRGSFYDALRSGEYLTTMAFRNPPKDQDYLLLPFEDCNLIMCSAYVTARNYRLSKREKDFIEFVRS